MKALCSPPHLPPPHSFFPSVFFCFFTFYLEITSNRKIARIRIVRNPYTLYPDPSLNFSLLFLCVVLALSPFLSPSLPPSLSVHVQTQIGYCILNQLRVRYINHGPLMLYNSLFPKKRNTVLHNHSTLTSFSKFNIDGIFFCLIMSPWSSFVCWHDVFYGIFFLQYSV